MTGMKNRIFSFGSLCRAGLAAAALTYGLCAPVQSGEIPRLTNADIVTFVKAGLAPQLILDRIRNSDNSFDMSTQSAIALKENGVPDDVIAAMLVSAGRNAVGAETLSPLPTLNAASARQPLASPFSGANPSRANQLAGSAAVDGDRFLTELSAISGGTPEARRAASAWMLANKAAVVGPLREAMLDSRPEMQAAAIHALGGLNDRESIPEIRRNVLNPSLLVRRNAAEALVAMNDADAIVAAEKSLGQGVSPQDGFIRIVGHARTVRAVGELARILADSQTGTDRAAAAWALAQIGPPAGTALPAVEKALTGDSDPAVRREAARAAAALHDPASAGLLQKACRADPEVRKVTLEAMAEYPETAGFLAGVMNLGADQIAADELDAARASLRTLTGQDFAFDGARWTAWLAQNGAGSASLPGMPGVGERVPPPPAAPPAPGVPNVDAIGEALATPPAGQRREVDVAQWGIVVDPGDIPMVPEVDGAAGSLPPGLAGLAGLLNQPGSSSGPAGTGAPSPLSASDFGESGSAGRSSSIFPGVSSGSSLFRSRETDPRDDAPAPALPPPPTTSSTWDRAAAPASPPAPFAAAAAPAPAPQPASDMPGIRLPLPPSAGGAEGGMTSDLPNFAPLPGDGFSGIYSPEPEPEPEHAYGGYGEPDYGATDPYSSGASHVDVSGYGGSSAFTDELHSEAGEGTGQLVSDLPPYSGSTMMTDPNFIPSGDMPMEAYEYDDAPAVMPPPPGGILSGADDSYGMADEGWDDGSSGMGLPPFSGGDSAGAAAFPEDADADSGDMYAGEDGGGDESAILSGNAGSAEKESVIVSGRVGGAAARTAAPARTVNAAPAAVPAAPPASAPAAAPAAPAVPAAPRVSRPVSKPAKGASVWVPGEDEGESQSGGASGTPETPDDTSFRILPAPEGEVSEYISADELMDMETYREMVGAPAAEPADAPAAEEPDSAPAAPSTGGVSLPVPGAASEQGAGDYLKNDPYGDFAPAPPGGGAPEGGAETESAYKTYEEYTAEAAGSVNAQPSDSPDSSGASAPGLALPLPGGGASTGGAMETEAGDGEAGYAGYGENSDGGDAPEDAPETAPQAFGSVNAGETTVFDAAEAEDVLREAGAAAAAMAAEMETALPAEERETPASMPSAFPDDFAVPEDFSGSEQPSLPPFEISLPHAATGQEQPGGLSIPPLGAPQIQLPDPVSGGEDFPAMDMLPIPQPSR